YSSTNLEAVQHLLRRYHVGYLYVGWLERLTYPPGGLAKFDRDKDLFELVYENPETKIYRVVGAEAESIPVPTREKNRPLPAPTPKPPENEREEPPHISEAPSQEKPPYAGMKEPRDAAIDRKGRLWVADFGNSRMRVFDAKGGLLGGWGGRGSGAY